MLKGCPSSHSPLALDRPISAAWPINDLLLCWCFSSLLSAPLRRTAPKVMGSWHMCPFFHRISWLKRNDSVHPPPQLTMTWVRMCRGVWRQLGIIILLPQLPHIQWKAKVIHRFLEMLLMAIRNNLPATEVHAVFLSTNSLIARPVFMALNPHPVSQKLTVPGACTTKRY